jgi:hypothetical protein
MAILISSNVTLSTAANTKTADLVSGVNQFVPAGTIELFARSSAAGMNHSLTVNSVPLVDDQPISFFGATGALSTNDHKIINQKINGGRIQYFLRNTTGGALTTDYQINFTPGK